MNNTTGGFDYKDQKITDVVSYIGTGKNQQKATVFLYKTIPILMMHLP